MTSRETSPGTPHYDLPNLNDASKAEAAVRRAEIAALADVVGQTEAARQLGITRERVRQQVRKHRIDTGSLVVEHPPESTEGEPTLTGQDVARALGVSKSTVQKWDMRGVMPFTPRRLTVPGMKEPIRVYSPEDLERLRIWWLTWERDRQPGGRAPHLTKGSDE
jgi:predicted DNA-binding protein (UPF0251 family)